MTDRDALLEKLRRIEALYAGGTTAGERSAAEAALGRIQAKLAELKETDPAVEYRFPMPDPWSRKLFLALLRRYGLRPYRLSRQRRNTVMARVSKSFLNSTLWPEFVALNAALRAHLDEITNSIIKEAISPDTSEAEEIRGELNSGEAPEFSG